jgi:hypothetical protein
VTLLGAATGFQSFAVIGNGNTTYYTIAGQTGSQWEVGIGTYTSSGTTLARTTVLSNSAGTQPSALSFSAGTKDVFVTYPSQKSVSTDTLAYPPAIGSTTPAAGSFTSVTVPVASGNAVISPNTSITSWLYSDNSFSVSSQETSPTGLFIGSNGTKMYINGSSGDDVNEYTLGTAWNITTATFVTIFSTSAQDTAPQDIFFKPDGLSMFVIGSTNDTVFQYTLTVAWDISTASYASKSFSVASQEATPLGLWFKTDGLSMYVVGSSSDTVFQYTLSTAWDVSTASYASISYSVAAQDTSPVQVNLSADGTKMWVLGATGDDIWEYSLGTAWNVSTATPVNNFYVGFQDTSPQGLFIDSTAANRVYIVGSTNDAVFQYNTATNSVDFSTDKLYTPGTLSINGNLVAGANAYVDGTLVIGGAVTAVGAVTASSTVAVSSTLTASAAVTFSGTTTSLLLGTSQTTGLITVGGTTGTGIITVGQSTGAQTLNLATGATATATTKTVNVGTAGLSGSTTNINIGSAVSGATSSVTANGVWTYSSYANIEALFEAATITASAPAATTNFDVITQAVQYYTTNASANFTFNIRGNSGTTLNTIMATGQSCTIALLVTNGATAYYPTAYQVDGSSVTPKWQTGTAPTAGNASALDVYVLTVIKTASATFTVLASQTKFA